MKKRIIEYSFVLISNIRIVKIAIRFSTTLFTSDQNWLGNLLEVKLFKICLLLKYLVLLIQSCVVILDIRLSIYTYVHI